jgi:ferric-dicitrate binding protein FerR (iron transport regulator)
MNLTDAEVLELNALCNALIDGAISHEEHARLEQMLRSSDDARRFYVRAMALSSSLMQYAGEMQAEAPDLPPVKGRISRPAAWIWALGSLAAAASIIFAFWLGWTKEPRTNAPNLADIAAAPVEGEEAVARISGAKDCHWTKASYAPGDELRRGQQLHLESGFAEITFDCGAQVTLEGPAELDLNSAWEAVLHRGTLKAHVPGEAVGFRISNPSVDVVDLGTEFSMVADPAGATEVFVLKGSVETTGRDATGHESKPVVLREKQARRFARAGGGDVDDREAKIEKFLLKIPLERFTRPTTYVHWSFDEAAGNIAPASVPGYEAKLVSNSDINLSEAHAGGHFGQALRLDGQLFARASFPGIRERTPRTVAFWINVPEDASLPDAGALLAWPLGDGAQNVTIGWNRDPNQGVLGALRTDAGRASVVGSATLRDGHWHHLAVVFAPKGKDRPDGPWQVRQYVDGRLETPSYKNFAKRPKDAPAPAPVPSAPAEDALWIGRAVDDADGTRFRGMLDELFVADAALTPQEIRYLKRNNKPATLEILAAQ